MYRRYPTALSVILVVLALMFAGSEATAQKYLPKVDNFIFLYDETSSMDEVYKGNAKKRAVLAREAMHSINQDIPGYDFVSGLYSVVPSFKAYLSMINYETLEFEYAIEQTQLPEKHLGPQTPLSEGLARIGPVLNNLSGPTAVILFSDGGENRGGSPEDVIESFHEQSDLCFHFVSYAHTEEEKENIERMSSVNDCSQTITGEEITDPEAREEFVKKIFLKEIKDSDGDGVPDHRDKCPDTPKDLVVDEDGCPIPKRISMDIKFDFDKSEIKPEFHDELKKVADFMLDRKDVDVVVEGHTDAIGTEEYNKKLSQRRASSVKDYLVENFGISSSRITTEAYGESEPIAANDNPEGRQKNRRVEGVFPTVFKKK